MWKRFRTPIRKCGRNGWRLVPCIQSQKAHALGRVPMQFDHYTRLRYQLAPSLSFKLYAVLSCLTQRPTLSLGKRMIPHINLKAKESLQKTASELFKTIFSNSLFLELDPKLEPFRTHLNRRDICLLNHQSHLRWQTSLA